MTLRRVTSDISATPRCLTITVAKLLRRPILIRVILVGILSLDVMLMVHVLGILLGSVTGTFTIVLVHAWKYVSFGY